MRTEASDIVKLLRMLADDLQDHTCLFFAREAERGTPILDVAYQAILQLAREKAHAQKIAIDVTARSISAPIIIKRGDIAPGR